jgi:hypothetical protein
MVARRPWQRSTFRRLTDGRRRGSLQLTPPCSVWAMPDGTSHTSSVIRLSIRTEDNEADHNPMCQGRDHRAFRIRRRTAEQWAFTVGLGQVTSEGSPRLEPPAFTVNLTDRRSALDLDSPRPQMGSRGEGEERPVDITCGGKLLPASLVRTDPARRRGAEICSTGDRLTCPPSRDGQRSASNFSWSSPCWACEPIAGAVGSPGEVARTPVGSCALSADAARRSDSGIQAA